MPFSVNKSLKMNTSSPFGEMLLGFSTTNGKIISKLSDRHMMSYFPGFPQMTGTARWLCHFPGSGEKAVDWHAGTLVSAGSLSTLFLI